MALSGLTVRTGFTLLNRQRNNLLILWGHDVEEFLGCLFVHQTPIVIEQDSITSLTQLVARQRRVVVHRVMAGREGVAAAVMHPLLENRFRA